MEILFAIIAFVLFSVVSDAIEGQKKKRQEKELPHRDKIETKTKTKYGTKDKNKDEEIVIPPIVGIPREEQQQGMYTEPVFIEEPVTFQPKYIAVAREKASEQESNQKASSSAPKPLKQADIHSDVLLSAVAYAQILQPPKAYQYLATRSCRGDWGNTK